MRLKHGVDQTQVDPVLGLWIGVLARHHLEWTGTELVVTDLRRATSAWSSAHVVKDGELVRAVDFRRGYLDEKELAEEFCQFLLARYKSWLEVILEPEWLSPEALERRGGVLNVAPHVHIALRSVEWPVGII